MKEQVPSVQFTFFPLVGWLEAPCSLSAACRADMPCKPITHNVPGARRDADGALELRSP